MAELGRRRRPQTWPTYQEYKDWWAKEVHLGRRRMPTRTELRHKYTRLVELRGGIISDEDQRTLEHEYTEDFGGIDRSPNVHWRTGHEWRGYDGVQPTIGGVRGIPPINRDMAFAHLDGDPTNNDPSNIGLVPHEQIRDQMLPKYKPEATGFTIAEAMQMSLKVATVLFNKTLGETYEYLVPGDTTIAEGVLLFAVVTRATGKIDETGHFSVAQVIEIKDLIDAEFDGKLKHVVTLFTAESYNQRIERQNKRERLLKQANKIAEDQHTIEKLTKLIGDSEEGKKLLAQIAELDNE